MGAIGTAAAASSSSGSSTFLILIVVFIGLIYFMAIRPGRNRQKRVQQQQNTVLPGARVRTTAGMYATVVAVDGDDVVLEVAPDVEVRYMKRAIMEVLSPGDEVPAEDEAETDGAEAEYEDDAVHETEPDLNAPAGQYGDDLVINGQRDAAGNGTAAPSVNGEHSETKPESATKE
jgi:preprotein translocase subunit YajC